MCGCGSSDDDDDDDDDAGAEAAEEKEEAEPAARRNRRPTERPTMDEAARLDIIISFYYSPKRSYLYVGDFCPSSCI